MEISDLTIEKFHEGLVRKEFSAFEITEKFFGHIEEMDGKINAFLRITKDLALSEASRIDVELAEGKDLGLLAGVPIALKDNMMVEGEVTTAASKILESYRASYDATVVSKLKEAGAVILGKTNLDEFAMGSSTENSGFKTTKNPYDTDRVPGGSSGGSAAAVASGMALAALGSDTGGSIRQPAGFCGVAGLKPTYGAVSRYGLIAMASSLDQIGSFGKTVRDAAILFKEIAGRDEMDSTSISLPQGYGDEILNPKLEDIKKLKIGIPKEYFIDGLSSEVKKAIDLAMAKLKSLGLEIKEISLPHTKYALSAYYIIMPAEVSANLARFDGIRYSRIEEGVKSERTALWDIYFNQKGRGFGSETQRRIILGNFVLSSGYYDAYYSKAQKVRHLIKQDFESVFNPSAGGNCRWDSSL
ncbi:MAG: Asp-tRNA(Asn)/Glu-tRNA(Gln) amidotransferase subunit GatA [Candidatus Wolfebacteria bacterium]|nr:Asp-tRNA(Asn)/Glu-tRNA(Gln) amidotransferase subunit GatA [Candidatus Wolfebacteria bacterium]